MPKSNTLKVLGQVISNPKRFARESRRAQQDYVQTQEDLAKTQRDLALAKQALADADFRIANITRPLPNFGRDDDNTDRTRHLKAAYERIVSQLRSEHPEEEAMSLAVGGGGERVGSMELALLRHFGLRPDDYLIDVGCGSGRLAKPLTSYLSGHYSGFDVVADLVEHARKIAGRSDWRFSVVDHIQIPEPDGCADMVCFFSVFTHLLHEQSYWYLEEAIRVLKPGGKIVFSFVDFAESVHWPIFVGVLQQSKASMDVPIDVFISKEMIRTWSLHLNVTIEAFVGATEAILDTGAFGQSLCVLRKPCVEAEAASCPEPALEPNMDVENDQGAQRIAYVSASGLSTPIPDFELIFLVNGHRDQHVFDISRRATVKNIAGLLAEAGIDYRDFRSILDFGCGCGRVLAGWEGMLPEGAKLHGCDINYRLIAFCKENIGFAETKLTGYYPPAPYTDGQFDFVYLGSVYTHLSLAAILQWTGELTRIVKSGGVVMLSYHGTYFAQTLADISKKGSATLAKEGFYIHLHVPKESTWEGSNEYATFMTGEFLLKLFCGFDFIALYPGISRGPNPFASFQDIVILRRRSDI